MNKMSFELLIKWFPILAVLAAGFIGYGEIKTDIQHLSNNQVQQFEQITHRLDRIEDRLNK